MIKHIDKKVVVHRESTVKCAMSRVAAFVLIRALETPFTIRTK